MNSKNLRSKNENSKVTPPKKTKAKKNKPTIAITIGDPAGIGPEITLRAISSPKVLRMARPLVIGDLKLLNRIAKKLFLPLPSPSMVVNISNIKGLKAGRPTRESSVAMIDYITEAVTCVLAGKASAVVTAPINKESAKLGGFKFPGHTEYLAHLTKAKNFVMMLSGSSLKVSLVTIHEPIKKVPSLLTQGKILKTIEISNEALKKYFGIKKPRIAVCGLNPHAGETHGGGSMGEEERKIIEPAVDKARIQGIDANGPLPPDTLFYQAVRQEAFDLVVCMYHDQGLIPLKLLHFEDGVNTTLGLPIIRTSPDHGTAYPIAWKGSASANSMIAALLQAAEMAK
ncbi:MAG: 4-hydroxythreonine-4-phosphate dehydrogenase PdxA [Deltaproteobacteria bacterium]|nr:4-hydroxythreonine-4-phosphate dehydrogenase PdxA [Deltaproteobacteria bacterium]